ncbi:MAG: hypothetical protein U9O64_01875 [Campylobacterota bacterium]|nr:hypothetical protein [Campylobacterota bacterium]
MHHFYLIFFIFLLSGCVSSPEPDSPTQTVTSKILLNKTDAQNARDEYSALQNQRIKE